MRAKCFYSIRCYDHGFNIPTEIIYYKEMCVISSPCAVNYGRRLNGMLGCVPERRIGNREQISGMKARSTWQVHTVYRLSSIEAQHQKAGGGAFSGRQAHEHLTAQAPIRSATMQFDCRATKTKRCNGLMRTKGTRT